MQVREAKDFLVQQVVEQTCLERVSLSDIERRMMYFTEGEDAEEDPEALYEQFDAEWDNDQYEVKMAGLLQRAHKRLKQENSEGIRRWNEALSCLRKGDHYTLALMDVETRRPPYDSLKLLGTALLVIAVGGFLIYLFSLISDHYGIHGGPNAATHRLMPIWMKYLAWGLMIVAYICGVILPRLSRNSGNRLGELAHRMFSRTAKDKPRT